MLVNEPILVGEPPLIGGLDIDAVNPDDFPGAGLDRRPRVYGVDERNRLGRVEVPWPGLEPVWLCGQGADGAQLDSVAGEVRGVRLIGEGDDLNPVGPILELDQRVTRDLVGESGTEPAEDASLAIQQDEVGDRDGFDKPALLFDVARLTRTIRKRLVLQRAFAALVTNGAVEWMVDQQELDDPLLSLGHDVGPGVDDHPVAHRGGTGRDQRHAAGKLDLDQAHPAQPDRLNPPVVTEARDIGPGPTSGVDERLPGIDFDVDAVEGDRYRGVSQGAPPLHRRRTLPQRGSSPRPCP